MIGKFTGMSLAATMLLGAEAVPAQAGAVSDTPVTLTVDASRYYPDRAQRMAVAGWARLRCVARPDATLDSCVLVGEQPTNYGFGEALIALSREMRVRPEALSTVVGKPAYFKIGFLPDEGGGFERDPVKAPDSKLIELARPVGADTIGMATVSCLVPLAATAPLRDCAAVAEGPAGQGFGAAGIGLAQRAYGANFGAMPPQVTIWLGRYELKVLDGRREIRTFGANETSVIVNSMVPARSIAALPERSVQLVCGWALDGQLQNCTATRVAAFVGGAPISSEDVAAAIAFIPNLRLVRKVTFSINWGQ